MSSGEVGVLELSDLIITTKGTATHFAGVEWNMKGDLVGDYPGMWGRCLYKCFQVWAPTRVTGDADVDEYPTDVHFRIGGATGTNMQVDQCPQDGTDCQAGLKLLQITPSGGGYFQNVWVWVAE